MSGAEVIDLAISSTEVQSISQTITAIIQAILAFANKYGVGDQFDVKRMEDDFAIFLVKRKVVNLRELRVSVLEDGGIQLGDTVTGKRRADLFIRLHYKDGVSRK